LSTGTEPPDDEELVRRFRAGARPALDQLVERYLRRALAVAREYTLDLDGAEDLVQDAFQRAIRGLAQFDERLRFAPWFFTILRNAGRNQRRQVARMRPLDEIAELPSQEQSGDALTASELRHHIDHQLSRMSAQQAACFRLCEIEGFSALEVGEMMGLAPPTVRTHAHRARLKLRDALRKLGYEAPE
jgi:RNA polymerase sigma-70 factor (ECF subfamily)